MILTEKQKNELTKDLFHFMKNPKLDIDVWIKKKMEEVGCCRSALEMLIPEAYEFNLPSERLDKKNLRIIRITTRDGKKYNIYKSAMTKTI